MKAEVLHDEHGRIIALSKVEDGPAKSPKARLVMAPMAGQQRTEVDLSKEQEESSLRDLHNNHRVDTSAKRLVKR